MKDAKTIVSHIISDRKFAKLRKHKIIYDFLKTIPKSNIVGVSHLSIFGNTLVFYLKHSTYKTNFDYKLKYIKASLNIFRENHKELANIDNIKSAVIFSGEVHLLRKNIKNDNYYKSSENDEKYFKYYIDELKEGEELNRQIPQYKERAKGEFVNHIENKELHDILEKIRAVIKQNG